MASYYVNMNTQDNGDHEVHREGCSYMPHPNNCKYLGEFVHCAPAVLEARRYYTGQRLLLLQPGVSHAVEQGPPNMAKKIQVVRYTAPGTPNKPAGISCKVPEKNQCWWMPESIAIQVVKHTDTEYFILRDDNSKGVLRVHSNDKGEPFLSTAARVEDSKSLSTLDQCTDAEVIQLRQEVQLTQ